MEATERVLTIVPDIVEEDEWTVGPAGEDWMIEMECFDDRIDVVGPLLRVVVADARLIRETMTAHI